jgi:hypothetical protein
MEKERDEGSTCAREAASDDSRRRKKDAVRRGSGHSRMRYASINYLLVSFHTPLAIAFLRISSEWRDRSSAHREGFEVFLRSLDFVFFLFPSWKKVGPPQLRSVDGRKRCETHVLYMYRIMATPECSRKERCCVSFCIPVTSHAWIASTPSQLVECHVERADLHGRSGYTARSPVAIVLALVQLCSELSSHSYCIAALTLNCKVCV